VNDATGHAFAYVYFEEEPGRRRTAGETRQGPLPALIMTVGGGVVLFLAAVAPVGDTRAGAHSRISGRRPGRISGRRPGRISGRRPVSGGRWVVRPVVRPTPATVWTRMVTWRTRALAQRERNEKQSDDARNAHVHGEPHPANKDLPR
jgi:hypothetical protein